MAELAHPVFGWLDEGVAVDVAGDDGVLRMRVADVKHEPGGLTVTCTWPADSPTRSGEHGRVVGPA